LQAHRQYKPFGLLESRVKLDFLANGIFNVTIYNLSTEDIPHEEPKVLTSGRLSSKAVSKSKLFELHRAYVFSAVLRIAKGLFAVLPARTAIITVIATTSDEWGGQIHEQPILSVPIRRRELEAIRLESVDAVDAMQNFAACYRFRKTKGFAPIQRVVVQDATDNTGPPTPR
jgi:hypothetical protein